MICVDYRLLFRERCIALHNRQTSRPGSGPRNTKGKKAWCAPPSLGFDPRNGSSMDGSKAVTWKQHPEVDGYIAKYSVPKVGRCSTKFRWLVCVNPVYSCSYLVGAWPGRWTWPGIGYLDRWAYALRNSSQETSAYSEIATTILPLTSLASILSNPLLTSSPSNGTTESMSGRIACFITNPTRLLNSSIEPRNPVRMV